jgi:hypothetical protein
MTDLALAARYLRTLHAVEQAHMLGDEDALVSIFASVDPVDLKELAAELEQAASENGGATTGGLTAHASETSLSVESPGAPVIHSGDIWTRRMHTPCD